MIESIASYPSGSQNAPQILWRPVLLLCRHRKGATLIPRVFVPEDARMPQRSEAKDAVIAGRHDLLASRVLVPIDARMHWTSGTKDAVIAGRQDLLASRVLVPIDARMHWTSGAKDVVIQVRHDFLLARSLVPAGAHLRTPKAIGPLGISLDAMRQSVFEEALLDKAWLGHERNPADWLISLGIHLGMVALVLIIPLFFSEAIDLRHFENTYLVASPPPGPPPPPSGAGVHPQQERPKPNLTEAKLIFAPMFIPKTVEILPAAAEIPSESTFGGRGGEAGGVPGGNIGGILGSIFDGTGLSAPPPPPPPTPTASSKLLRVGGEVKAPREIYKPAPEYPLLAKQGRIQGAVEIDAIIDERGNVIQMRAISGPTLLIDAALKAVRKWKYEPTYLNGEPCPIELIVNVRFRLS
jgi:periplasmic protein TonB